MGYTDSGTQVIQARIYTIYADITEDEVEKNENFMKTEFGADIEMEALYNYIEDTVKFAVNTNQTYSPGQIKSVTYNLVFQTGVFDLLCRKCKVHLAVNCTLVISRFNCHLLTNKFGNPNPAQGQRYLVL